MSKGNPIVYSKESMNIIPSNNQCAPALGWVYLNTTDNPLIYKIGGTVHEDPRIRAAAEGGICLCSCYTYNVNKCKEALRIAFRSKYMPSHGNEFFIGPMDDMVLTFNSVICEFHKKKYDN